MGAALAQGICCQDGTLEAATRAASRFATIDADEDSEVGGSVPSRSSNRRYTQDSEFGDGHLWDEVMREFWPAVRGFLENYVLRGIVEPALKKLIWGRMRLERCSLGEVPPRILGAKAFRRSEERGEEEHTVEVALNMDWPGDQVDIALLIDTGLKAMITRLSLRGTFCLELRHFQPEAPLIAGMTLYFMNRPEVDMTFGSEVAGFPALEGRIAAVESVIEQQLANFLVVPARIAVHLSPSISYYELRFPLPQGILEVELRRVARIPSEGKASMVQSLPLLGNSVFVEFRLGADEWASPQIKVDGGGTARCLERCALFVDEMHGQTLVCDLRQQMPLQRRALLLGQARISPENLVERTLDGRLEFPLDTGDGGRRGSETPLLELKGTFRPFLMGSGHEEAKELHPLHSGVRGVLVVILDSVRNLSRQLAGHHVFVSAQVGEARRETWEVPAQQLTLEDVAEGRPEQLEYLISKDKAGPGLTPENAAWVLGLQPDRVAACAGGRVDASFGQELRLQVKDPFSERLELQLRRGGKRPGPVARYLLPLRELISRPGWTLPLEGRNFTSVEAEFQARAPDLLAKIQLLGLEGTSPMARRSHRLATSAQLRAAELRARPSLFQSFQRGVVQKSRGIMQKSMRMGSQLGNQVLGGFAPLVEASSSSDEEPAR